MKKKILSLVLVLSMAFFAGALVHTSTYADAFDAICHDSSVSDDVKAKAGCNGGDLAATEDSGSRVAQNIINTVIGISSTVALVFIIIGGVKYMTANGDSGKITKAKDTILYAVIGLIVCALSYGIVNWIISTL